jgi:hypothetical protein
MGLVLAAASVAGLIRLLQQVLRPNALCVAVVLVALGLVAPSGWGRGGWRVPRQWESWGSTRYLFVFGYAIGLGFLTAIPSLTLIGFQVWAWSLPARGVLAAAEASFVLGRLLDPVLSGYQAGRQGDIVRATDRLVVRIAALGRLEPVVAFALAGVLVADFLR